MRSEAVPQRSGPTGHGKEPPTVRPNRLPDPTATTPRPSGPAPGRADPQGAAVARESVGGGAEPVSRNSRIAKATSTMTVVHTTTIVVG
jgi:hypothetical protein